MDIKGLQYFVMAAERLNFTSAARECYITQTAMSLHIGKMEDELGFKLFNRNKKAVELTEAGKDFYRRARSVIEHYERSVRCSASIAQGMTGVVNITLPSCHEGFLFMDRFTLFCEKYPKVELNILVKPHNELVASVKSGKSDIAIGSPDDMELDPDFTVIKLREAPTILLCSASHPLAGKKKVTGDMLKDLSVIMSGPEGMPQTYKSLQNIGVEPGLERNSILHASNMDEMLLLIELGRGVGLLPSFVFSRVAPETAGVVSVRCEIDGKTPMMTIAGGYLKDNQNPVVANFIATLL